MRAQRALSNMWTQAAMCQSRPAVLSQRSTDMRARRMDARGMRTGCDKARMSRARRSAAAMRSTSVLPAAVPPASAMTSAAALFRLKRAREQNRGGQQGGRETNAD